MTSETINPSQTHGLSAQESSDNPSKTTSVLTPGFATTEDMEVRYDTPWLTSLLRPALIATMTACLTIGLLGFLRYAIPDLPFLFTGATLALTLIATLLGCISTTWLAQPSQRGKRNTGLRLAEFGLLLGITRLAVWITVGNWPPFELFITKPLEAILDGAFIMALILVGLAWTLASAITGDFLKMSLQPDEIYAAKQRTGRSGDDPTPPNYTNRRGVLGSFVSKWIMGGVFMVLLSAGSQLESSENGFFAIGRQNIDPVVITATVIYFLTGLVLISQGQFAVLRARWTLEKVPSSGSVLRNWPIYGAMLIGGMGLFATLLPFGGTFYFARILRAVIGFAYLIVATAMQIMLGLFGAFLALFLGESDELATETPPPSFEPFQMPEAAEEVVSAPPWVGGTIFWIILTLLLGYAAYIYLSGRGFNLGWLQRFWQLLTMRLREIFGAYGEWQVNRRKSANGESDAEEPTTSKVTQWLNRIRLQNLNPDQQVRYFYISLLQQAEDSGIGRRSSETPIQFIPRLLDALHPAPAPVDDTTSDDAAQKSSQPAQTVESDTVSDPVSDLERSAEINRSHERIASLTDAFLRVRYAGSNTDDAQIPPLKKVWESLKRQLQNAKSQ